MNDRNNLLKLLIIQMIIYITMTGLIQYFISEVDLYYVLSHTYWMTSVGILVLSSIYIFYPKDK